MIEILFIISLTCIATLVVAQDYQDYPSPPRPAPVRLSNSGVDTKPTPVPILKQINRHNEDGSYTYGYEGADGSFKIETKLATGEVKGKYGYTDETGKVRVVEYGANKYGFQPAGEGITVAPPTLVDETTDKNGKTIYDYEDEQLQQAPAPKYKPQPKVQRPAPQPQYYDYELEQQPQPAPQRFSAPIQPKQYSAPAPPPPPRFHVPGAQPAPVDVVYSQKSRPARIEPEYEDVGPQTFPEVGGQQQRNSFPSFFAPEPAPAPKPKQAQYAAPRFTQVHQPQPQPSYSPQGGRSGGVLDQLAKDYALPQTAAQPLHDISFGYY